MPDAREEPSAAERGSSARPGGSAPWSIVLNGKLQKIVIFLLRINGTRRYGTFAGWSNSTTQAEWKRFSRLCINRDGFLILYVGDIPDLRT